MYTSSVDKWNCFNFLLYQIIEYYILNYTLLYGSLIIQKKKTVTKLRNVYFLHQFMITYSTALAKLY